jgi:uncharacterized phage protein (TIGR02218 family)
MIILEPAMEALNTAQSFRYARLFKIVRMNKDQAIADENNAETGDLYVIDNATTIGIGTEFTTPAGTQRIRIVSVWMRNRVSPNEASGSIYAEIFASDGSSPAAPTGSAIATSKTIDASLIGSSVVQLYFNFEGEHELDGSTDYFLVIRHPDGNATEFMRADGDATSGDDGNYAYETSSGWTGVSGEALRFEVWVKPTDENYFTSHDNQIPFEGKDYKPAGGQTPSAHRSESGMKTQSMEFLGVLSSSEITDDDVRKGYYDDAEITEYQVDWMFPWCGYFTKSIYYIAKIARDGEIWVAEIRSKMGNLQRRVGDSYSSRCRYRFCQGYDPSFADGCKLNIADYTHEDVAVFKVDVIEPKRIFWVATSEFTGSPTEQWFDHGYVKCTTGDNIYVKRGIARVALEEFDTATDRLRIELDHEMPDEIKATDVFTFYQGCDWTAATCQDLYGNIINFGGFPFVPGQKKAMFTPPIG